MAVTVKAVQVRQVSMVTEIVAGPDEVTDLLWTQIDCLNVVGRAEQEIGVETTLEIPPGKPELEVSCRSARNRAAFPSRPRRGNA